jgi:hypothetical protein
MKALMLDASAHPGDRTALAADGLEAELRARGVTVERLLARDLNVKPCTGCFGCWVRTPGECVIPDDARTVAEKVVAADIFNVVSPVTFGSYGSLAKGVLDRLICLILPDFTLVDGEVHHKRRYAQYPIWIGLGTLAEPDEAVEALFARLVERNSVNLHNPAHAAGVVAGEASVVRECARLLDAVRIPAGVTP